MKTDLGKCAHPFIINIEGNDGTGKRSVACKLQEVLSQLNLHASVIDFPQYESLTGNLVQKFLTGDLCGDPVSTDPYLGSMPYTLDRISYLHQNFDLFSDYQVLIFNRSYMSNFFYQFSKYFNSGRWKTTKMSDLAEWLRIQYRLEIEQTPLNMIEVPERRVFNIYIKADSLQDNHDKLLKRYENDASKLDLHEQNFNYLKSVEDIALSLCGIPFTDNQRINAFYNYQIVGMANGTDEASIEVCISNTVNSILAIIGLAGYTQRIDITSLTKKLEEMADGSGD